MNKTSKYSLLLKATYNDIIDELYYEDWYYDDRSACNCASCTGIYSNSMTYTMNKYNDAEIEEAKYMEIYNYEAERKSRKEILGIGKGHGCGGATSINGKGYGHGALLCGYDKGEFNFSAAMHSSCGSLYSALGCGSGAGNVPGEFIPGYYGSEQSYESYTDKEIMPYEIIIKEAHL